MIMNINYRYTSTHDIKDALTVPIDPSEWNVHTAIRYPVHFCVAPNPACNQFQIRLHHTDTSLPYSEHKNVIVNSPFTHMLRQ
jgi:hypothetical protein